MSERIARSHFVTFLDRTAAQDDACEIHQRAAGRPRVGQGVPSIETWSFNCIEQSWGSWERSERNLEYQTWQSNMAMEHQSFNLLIEHN
jgi:hypothetical protein